MKLRILIIDDEPCIRDSFAMHLSDQGHDVYVAETPALCEMMTERECRKHAPCADLLMIDENMPAIRGLEFIRRQAQRNCNLLPRHQLVMSGTVTPEKREEARDIGCRIVQKPFRLDELDAFVARVTQNLAADRTLSPLPGRWNVTP